MKQISFIIRNKVPENYELVKIDILPAPPVQVWDNWPQLNCPRETGHHTELFVDKIDKIVIKKLNLTYKTNLSKKCDSVTV